jgi:hypothetical protein
VAEFAAKSGLHLTVFVKLDAAVSGLTERNANADVVGVRVGRRASRRGIMGSWNRAPRADVGASTGLTADIHTPPRPRTPVGSRNDARKPLGRLV